MPLRYALMSLTSMCRTTLEPDLARHWMQTTGKPLQEILAHRAEFIRFLVLSGRHATSLTNYYSETAPKVD